jgi:acyl carrier protein
MSSDGDALKREIKELIIGTANIVEVDPEEIDDDAPIFGNDLLGLDSIDALEITVALQKKFGVHIDSQNLAVEILQSVNTIASFVESSRQGEA